MSLQNNIYPKDCTYNCNTRIYWNISVNEYWEVFTKKKHICPNRGNKSSGTTTKDKYFDIEKLFLPETSGFEFMKKNYNYNPLLKQIRIKLKENLEKSISALS